MAIDATGTPTTLGIPKFNTAVDAPSGKGGNAQMDAIDVLIAATPQKPVGLASGEFMVYNGTTFVRSTVTRPGADSLGTGAPDATKFLRGDGAWVVPTGGVAAGVLLGVQIFTSSGTYTPTAGTNRVHVECIGGGGAGGGAAASNAGSFASQGGGGGGGAYSASLLTAGFSGVSYAIGAGGTAGASGGNPGNAGGDTTFNSTVIVAKGGSGGAGGTTGNVAGGAGGAAASGTGGIKISGAPGESGAAAGGGNTALLGAGGAAGHGMGMGARNTTFPASSVVAGTAGQLYGGGGSGGTGQNTASTTTGGAGASGVIRIWEFA